MPSVLDMGDPLHIPGFNFICIHPSEPISSLIKSINITPGDPPKDACLESSDAAVRLIERLTISVIVIKIKWAIQGSNQGHPACKAGALPLS